MKSIAFDCFTNDQVKEINKVIKKNIVRKEDVSNVSSDSARMLGHITYLSDDSMRQKFGRDLREGKLTFWI